MTTSPRPSRLLGKRALVTGGGSGIGRAIALDLAAAGCDLAVHYRSSAAAAAETVAAARALGVRAEAFAADLTDATAAAGLVERAAGFLGGLDVLVNNAGDLVGRRTLDACDDAFWRTVQDVNLTSLMAVTRASLRHLANPASIVNLSSLAGRKGGHPGSLAYSTFKGAVLTFTRALANELGPRGVRVNAVAPGLILGTHFHTTHTTKASADATIAGIPLGRAGCAEDVARAVTFLAGELDGFITGATLDINGGVWAA
ncbi:MAG: SDR family oxidoreductase [Planctomycetes bacterium]|nr:SDR family oxidoreductase [Planctomycetota bacterium]